MSDLWLRIVDKNNIPIYFGYDNKKKKVITGLMFIGKPKGKIVGKCKIINNKIYVKFYKRLER